MEWLARDSFAFGRLRHAAAITSASRAAEVCPGKTPAATLPQGPPPVQVIDRGNGDDAQARATHSSGKPVQAARATDNKPI